MRKIVLYLSFLIFHSYFIYAQPAIQWQVSLGGTNGDIANIIKQTSDEGYIVAGYSYSNDGDVSGNHGNRDYWIVKLNNIGVIQWQKSLGGTYEEIAISIEETNDGGYIVVGSSQSNDGDVTGHYGMNMYSDYWVVKLDSTGTMQWQKSYGGTCDDFATSVQETNDDGFIVAGYSCSFDSEVTGNHNSYDYWIVRIDSIGTIQWEKSLGGTGFESASTILQTYDSGYIVAGSSQSNNDDVSGNHGSFDYWIVKLDWTGNILWQKSLGGTGNDQANSIQQTTDGGYIVAGYSSSNDSNVNGNHGDNDLWIVKIDSISNIQWEKSFGGTVSDQGYSIQQTTDGGYIVAGTSLSNDGDVTGNHGSADYWILKIDSIGNVQWQKSLGGTNVDASYSIQQTADGGYIAAGFSKSNDGNVSINNGNADYWIVKLSPVVNVIANEIQNSVLDLQITPVPVSNETMISFSLTASVKTSVEICDVKGCVIKNLSSKNLNPGLNQIVWNATDDSGNKVSEGVYFVSIVSDNYCESKKVVVLRN